MPTWRLDDDHVTAVYQKAISYIKTNSRYREYMPVERIPLKRTVQWREIEPFVGPAMDLDGTHTQLAASAFTPASVQVAHLGYHFEWKEIDVLNANDSGVPLQETDISEALWNMTKAIERFALQGSMSWETPGITGILGHASITDVGDYADLNAVYWLDQGGPAEHARAAALALNDVGVDPPYTWIIDRILDPGLNEFNSAYNDRIAREVVGKYGFDRVVPVPAKATAPTKNDTTIYPMKTKTADFGSWAAFPSMNPDYFALLEVSSPILTIDPKLDIKSRTFYGRLDWWGSVRITHPEVVVCEFEVDDSS